MHIRTSLENIYTNSLEFKNKGHLVTNPGLPRWSASNQTCLIVTSTDSTCRKQKRWASNYSPCRSAFTGQKPALSLGSLPVERPQNSIIKKKKILKIKLVFKKKKKKIISVLPHLQGYKDKMPAHSLGQLLKGSGEVVGKLWGRSSR